MKLTKTVGKLAVLMTILLFVSVRGSEATVVLDFEGIGDQEAILDYYNGGTGGNGSGPGTNYGISFGADALALIDSDAGGTGNTGLEPTPETVAFFLNGPGVIMDVAAGFTTGFSFFYSSVTYGGSVNVYDGLGASGNLLASLSLTALGYGPGDPNGAYSNWAAIGVLFGGTAKSVNFSGGANYIVFDDITLGSEQPGNPVPEPSTLILLGAGFAGIAAIGRKKLSK